MERLNAHVMGKVMPVLEAAWRANPHLRLGQLISNASHGIDVFYIGDGTLTEGLDKAIDGEWQ